MREDDDGSERTCVVDLDEIYSARRNLADRRALQRAALAQEPGEELSTVINEVVTQTRAELSSILEAHGVHQLVVTAKSAGDRLLEWDWNVQLTLILGGKLPR